MDIQHWQNRLKEFAQDRDWERFHTPKNLAVALSVEASELLEIFQWLTPEESQQVMAGQRADDVRDEVADVMIYLLRLGDVLGMDLADAVEAKLERNAERFPASAGGLMETAGGVRFADLLTADIPTEPGVYTIRRTSTEDPIFLAANDGGWFKGKNPTLPVERLESMWVPGAEVVYYGKAGGSGGSATLRSRLRQFAAFASGRPVGHWGGRALLQLADWRDLRVSWEISGRPVELEGELIAQFKARYGTRPFANLRD